MVIDWTIMFVVREFRLIVVRFFFLLTEKHDDTVDNCKHFLLSCALLGSEMQWKCTKRL
jgi:hypothetical protein